MISQLSVWIQTGDDDVRSPSEVWLRVFVSGRTAPYLLELTMRRRFGDRTWNATSWDIAADGISMSREDIERLEIAFSPAPHEFMEPDQWVFTGLVVSVTDSGVTSELYRNVAVNHRFTQADTWSTGTLATFNPSIGTVITVRDESGAPVRQAVLFLRGQEIGRTGPNGTFHYGSRLRASEPLMARKQIHEQDYYRGHHDSDSSQNWNYRVHLTNVVIGPDGVARPTVRAVGSGLELTLARANTLIGVNMLLSLQWDETRANMDGRVAELVRDFSSYLYNATDGQFFVETAQIRDRQALWDDSDIRCLADNDYRANVPNVTGGFLGWNVLGSAMIMSRKHGANVYAHEFGHFGLDLGDEYQDNTQTKCVASGMAGAPSSPFADGGPKASCMMWNQGSASKICSSHPDNPHTLGTRQGDQPCWDNLVGRYNWSDRWRLQTPVDRRASQAQSCSDARLLAATRSLLRRSVSSMRTCPTCSATTGSRCSTAPAPR